MAAAAFRSEPGQLLLQQLVPPSRRRSWARKEDSVLFDDAGPVRLLRGLEKPRNMCLCRVRMLSCQARSAGRLQGQVLVFAHPERWAELAEACATIVGG